MSWGGGRRKGPKGPPGDDGEPGTIGPTGPAGGGGVIDPYLAIAGAAVTRNTSGQYTVGCIFGVTVASTLSWIEHWLINSGTETYIDAIWNTVSNAKLATVSLVISSSGRHRFTLSSPLALSPGVKYTYGIWNSTNNAYCPQAVLGTYLPTTTSVPTLWGGTLIMYSTGVYSLNNDTEPTTTDSGSHTPYFGGLAAT